MSSIEATYEDGVFRPRKPVNLPQHCQVELEFRVRTTDDGADKPLAAETVATPIEDRLAELATEATSAEWEQLPVDLSDQLDHYIYGIPRT
jgi:predicted DNA-binding antitoxin AbrB/MazE fold protein